MPGLTLAAIAWLAVASADDGPPVAALVATPGGAELVVGSRDGVFIRPIEREGPSRPYPTDLEQVHDLAFSPDGEPLDHTLAHTQADEGVILARFDLAALRAYRTRETWGDAYRKPATYEALLNSSPAAVFSRQDSRRTPTTTCARTKVADPRAPAR